MQPFKASSERQRETCAVKHFISVREYLKSKYSMEDIRRWSQQDRWRKLCLMDLESRWCQYMVDSWLVPKDRKTNTLVLCRYKSICSILRKVPSKFQVKLVNRNQSLILVGPLPCFTIQRYSVPNDSSSHLFKEPFALRGDDYEHDGGLPDADTVAKKIPIGEVGLHQGAYTFSSIKDGFVFRTAPLSLQFVIFLCDEDSRPFHLQFAISDSGFKPFLRCEENYSVLKQSAQFKSALWHIREEYGVQVVFDGALRIVDPK